VSYQDIVAGIHARYRLVPGLEHKPVLPFEPSAIHDTPTTYTLLDRVDRSISGHVLTRRYRILNRTVFQWVDVEQAELELMPYIDTIPETIEADPQLSGIIQSGFLTVPEVMAVFVSIGGTLYRALDVYVEAPDKKPYRGVL
jgi:hypothetical protein